MKRNEAIEAIQRKIDEYLSNIVGAPDTALLASLVVSGAEEIGMKPPRLPEMDCQAIMDVYYGGYSFYQWEEEYVKDEKVAEAKRKRFEYSQLTGEQRVERIRTLRATRQERRDVMIEGARKKHEDSSN